MYREGARKIILPTFENVVRLLPRETLPIFRNVLWLSPEHIIDRYYPIKLMGEFLVLKMRPPPPNTSINVRGHKMFLDSMDALRLSVWGFYEPFVTQVFKKEIKKNDVVLDIGAHIGYYTLIAAKQCRGK
jgi:hypothetical protein